MLSEGLPLSHKGREMFLNLIGKKERKMKKGAKEKWAETEKKRGTKKEPEDGN